MDIAGSITPSLEWFNPFGVSQSALAAGLILGIFIYWGWDSTVSVNEESADPTEGPGKAAVVSTIVLLGIYVLVSVSAQAYHGVGFLKDNSDDVLSSLGKRRAGLAARQAADHRRADLGLGLLPDDDPARHALGALDGRQARSAEDVRRRSTRST